MNKKKVVSLPKQHQQMSIITNNNSNNDLNNFRLRKAIDV